MKKNHFKEPLALSHSIQLEDIEKRLKKIEDLLFT